MSEEQNILLNQLDKYWECQYCNSIIKDPKTAKKLGITDGSWGIEIPCPICGKNITKFKFPDKRFRSLFEMIDESYKAKRKILVIVLSQVAFESMLDDFLIRLLTHTNCPEDIVFAVTDELRSINSKINLIKSVTNKDLKNMLRNVGYKDMWKNFENIRSKRNSFMHTAKPKIDITENDMKEAFKFASDTIDLFSKLFNEYREWRPLFEPEDSPYFDAY